MAQRILSITLNRDVIKLTDLEYDNSSKEKIVNVHSAATT